MFYSRPDLPQLGLDLAEVDGGLGRPSQYRGRTADGRAVRLGYDRGRLSVAIEDGPAGLGRELISVQIGPRFNGDMLLEQICDLTGITLRGEKPRLSEEIRREAAERNWVLDWSGKTTYWVGDLNVTEAGGRSLARELAATFPDLRILEVYWDYSGEEGKRRYLPRRTISQCERAALFGFGVDEVKLARLLTREHVTLAELDEVFAYSLDFQFEWEVPALAAPAERLAAHHGRAVDLPEMRLGGSLETQFATDDPRGRPIWTACWASCTVASRPGSRMSTSPPARRAPSLAARGAAPTSATGAPPRRTASSASAGMPAAATSATAPAARRSDSRLTLSYSKT